MCEPTDVLVDRYVSLESAEIQEQLLDVCGSQIDARALPLLEQRLEEESASAAQYAAREYVRMSEKASQLADALRLLIAALGKEGTS